MCIRDSGGAYVPEILHKCVEELTNKYLEVIESEDFKKEFDQLDHNDFIPTMKMKIYPYLFSLLACIGIIETPETGALENFNFDHLLKHVPELKRFKYRISSYQFDPPLDSSDMEPAYWAKLVKIINYNYDYFDGFVILHGTDTVSYTHLRRNQKATARKRRTRLSGLSDSLRGRRK